MSAKGDTEWVDRSPPKSKAMKAAYAGLAAAEEYLREVAADGAEDEQREAIAITVEWHAEIGRLALAHK